ncbi:MAG: chemotaxis protein CheW [Sphingobium sp.]|jgi:purine-binding chemotaxis protein CheW|nr:chemotaxis protein CheW [Sphingobium sp.]MCI1270315.1 chemotaxis protein CheW [Sphingobium sp.]MCI1754581.1 chemotaxis protein CheW [Sphingobium sp.]MCI2052021.1 chemotaxis protein CheW [Sphingobium sp.]
MNGLYLFAHIAGTPIAVSTDEVDAVVRLNELSPVPGVSDHVAGLSALRSRVLTVIDAAALVRRQKSCVRPQEDTESEFHVIVCEISGHGYGILVDRVDDIQTIDTLPLPICGRIDPAWQPYAKGVIENGGDPHFLVSLSGFLELGVCAQAA